GARLSLAARTAQAWFELIEARLQVAVAKESVEGRRTFLKLLRGRFQRGLSRAQEVYLLQTDLSINEFQLAQRHDEYALARRRLEVLLGRYPAGLIETVEALPPFPGPLPAGLPSELLARRPDLVAALTRLKAAGLRVKEARAALLPRIQLTSSGGVSSEELNVLLDPKSLVWNVAGGLVQPILNGGRLRNEIRLNQARVEEALASYRNTVLTAFREVEDALTTEIWLGQQEHSLAEAVREAEASVELSKHAFRMGNPDLFSLLDSLRNLLDTRSQHLAVRRQLLSNRISLYLALGGGI
ncbi:MAG: TolC family protein, partial [Chloroflexi bacterium]|nr:TolC family protein [Chloroflexota bacterium]